ncbi:MAG: hypothetical protein BMS9Abin04_486 [Planctomycetia bacterium]|nr:MAG: hypothetical protein BMS9Abin04_486 [Planctomycetia bacterium]
MKTPSLRETTAEQLAKLLSCTNSPSRLWEPGELKAVFLHQLSLPPEVDPLVEEPAAGSSRPFATQLELLCLPDPSLPLLISMKQIAKSSVQHPDSPLPEEVATALYFAALAAALVRCGRRISRLDNAGLRWGFQWAIEQPWMVDELRGLFDGALAQVQ